MGFLWASDVTTMTNAATRKHNWQALVTVFVSVSHTTAHYHHSAIE